MVEVVVFFRLISCISLGGEKLFKSPGPYSRL